MAAGLTLGDLRYRIGAVDTGFGRVIDGTQRRLRGFQQTVQRGRQYVDGLNESLQRGGTRLRNWGLAATAAASGVAYAMNRMVNSTTKTATEVNKLHTQTGIATDSLQSLGYAAEQNDSSMDALGMALVRLTRRSAEAATGNQAYQRSFQRMNVELLDAQGNLRSAEELFLDMADSFENLILDEGERSRLAFNVLGDSGYAMLPVLAAGRQEIMRLADEAHRMGIVLSEENIAQFARYDSVVTTFRGAMRGLSMEISTAALPIFTRVAEAATGGARSFGEWVQENRELVAQGVILGGVLTGLAFGFGLVAIGASLGIRAIGLMTSLITFLLSPIGLLIGLSAALYVAWKSDWRGIRTTTESAVNFIQEQWDRLKKWWDETPLGKSVTELWAEIEAAWNDPNLTLKEKVLESVKITAKRIGFSDLWDEVEKVWSDPSLTLSEKTLESIRIIFNIDPEGETYEAIKKGLTTGDWSGFWGVAADVWRTGIKIAVALALASNVTGAVLNAIVTGLGLVTTGVKAFGVPGAIGALSVIIALAEAAESGDYKAFGANLIAALAAGIGAGVILGPYAGGVAFTIFLNFEVGTWIGDKLQELDESPAMASVRASIGTGPTQEATMLQEFLSSAPEERSAAVRQLHESLGETSFEQAPGFLEGLWRRMRYGAKKIGGAVADGLRDSRPDVEKAADDLAEAADERLSGESPPPKGPLSNVDVGGRKVGEAWAQGLLSSRTEVEAAASGLAQSVSDYLIGQSPPPEGPLKDVGKSGIIPEWLKGMVQDLKNAGTLEEALKILVDRIYNVFMGSLESRFPGAAEFIKGLFDEDSEFNKAIDGLDKRIKGLENGINSLSDTSRQWTNDLVRGLSNAIAYGHRLTDVVDNFTRMLASQFIETRILGPLFGASIFPNVGDGKFQWSSFANILEGLPVFHAGGLVMGGSGGVAVMHNGGMVQGLRQDEVPAILQTGERVLSRSQNDRFEQMLEEGRDANINLIINAVDAKSFMDLAHRNPEAITGVVMHNIAGNGELRKVIRNIRG